MIESVVRLSYMQIPHCYGLSYDLQKEYVENLTSSQGTWVCRFLTTPSDFSPKSQLSLLCETLSIGPSNLFSTIAQVYVVGIIYTSKSQAFLQVKTTWASLKSVSVQDRPGAEAPQQVLGTIVFKLSPSGYMCNRVPGPLV